MIHITAVRTESVVGLWPEIAPLITPAVALSGGRMGPDDVRDLVAGGRAQLWLASDGQELLGAIVGRPVQYPQRKALCVIFIAGRERERWQADMMQAVELGARRIGCDMIEGFGRKGWDRALPGSGYRVGGFSYEKDL